MDLVVLQLFDAMTVAVINRTTSTMKEEDGRTKDVENRSRSALEGSLLPPSLGCPALGCSVGSTLVQFVYP